MESGCGCFSSRGDPVITSEHVGIFSSVVHRGRVDLWSKKVPQRWTVVSSCWSTVGMTVLFKGEVNTYYDLADAMSRI